MKSFLIKRPIIKKPCIQRIIPVKQRNKLIAKAINFDEVSYYMIKGGFLYIFFYCSLQWYHYRNIRKDEEKRD